MPCNSDNNDSGDWSGLKQNGVNLMMALKPIGEPTGHASNKQIQLNFPDNMEHLQLNRVYRCTQTILNFYKSVVKKLDANPFVTKFNSWSANLYNPGHEIYGDLPEVFLLPKCQQCADNCKSPLTHSLKKPTNKTKILALLHRLHIKLKPLRITVLIDINFEKKECVKWLTKEFSQFTCLDFLSSEIKVKDPNTLCISTPLELDAKGTEEAFDIKVIEECRGMEFPALVTITFGGYSTYSGISITSPLIVDSWTRVTSCLCIIHVDDGFSKAFKNGLEDALKNNVAKKVEEQEMMIGYLKKNYSNYPKEKAWDEKIKINPLNPNDQVSFNCRTAELSLDWGSGICCFRKEGRKRQSITISTLRFENLTTDLHSTSTTYA